VEVSGVDEEYLVVLFDSTHHAVRAEKVAKGAGFVVRCIPTPRHISSDCGIVLRIRPEDRDGILGVLGEKKAGYDRVEPLRPG
jgi:hypothetical protein